jgi:hypothetical protein
MGIKGSVQNFKTYFMRPMSPNYFIGKCCV